MSSSNGSACGTEFNGKNYSVISIRILTKDIDLQSDTIIIQ